MYQQKTVRAFSIVATVLSIIGLLISISGALFLKSTVYTFGFFIGILSWAFLLWASIIGYKLCTSYKLYDDEYKKVGIRIYLIIVAFILFFFVGLIIGLALSVILFTALWALKRNYDEWDYSNTPHSADTEDAKSSESANEATSNQNV